MGEDDAPRRRYGGRTALLVLAVVVGLVLVAPVALLLARSPVERGRVQAEQAQDALLAEELDAAQESLTEARTSFRRARWLLRNPVTLVAGVVPITGSTLRTAGAIAWAGELTADGGAEALEALAQLPGGLAGLAPEGGRIPVERVEAVAPAVRRAADNVAEGRALVEASPDLLALDPVRTARRDAVALLGQLDATLGSAAALAEALPGFLGAEGPRRYFLAASNPAELRGTGGFLGAWSILEVDGGQLSLGDFSDIHELSGVQRSEAVPAPAEDFGDRYDRYGSRWRWTTVNVSPDFRSAAEIVEALYLEATGDRLDGVIAADPFAIEALMGATGPVQVPMIGTVEAERVVDLVTNEAYSLFDERDDRQRVLGTVAGTVLQSFLTQGAGDARQAVQALGRAAGGGHLLLHSVDRQEQAAFQVAGVAGNLPAGDAGDVLVLALNSQSNAKVDYYLEVAAHLRVTLADGGAARTVAAIDLENTAPSSGQPGYVIGPNMPDLRAGDNPFLLDLLCSARCRFDGFGEAGTETVARVGTDRGLSALGTQVLLGAGEGTSLPVSWTSEGAWTEDEGLLTYRLSTRGPGTVRAPELSLTVLPPAGTTIVAVEGGTIGAKGRIRPDAAWRGDGEIVVTLAREPGARLSSHLRQVLARPAFRLGG